MSFARKIIEDEFEDEELYRSVMEPDSYYILQCDVTCEFNVLGVENLDRVLQKLETLKIYCNHPEFFRVKDKNGKVGIAQLFSRWNGLYSTAFSDPYDLSNLKPHIQQVIKITILCR